MRPILSVIMTILILLSFSTVYAKGQVLLYKPNIVKCVVVAVSTDNEKVTEFRHR
jgi:hypothetical protein